MTLKGVKYWGKSDMDGGIAWARVNRTFGSESEALEHFWEKTGLNIQTVSGGAGQYFQHVSALIIGKYKTLVKVSFGFDC